MNPTARTYEFGDAALCVEISATSEGLSWELTHALSRTIEDLPGVVNAVPTFHTTFVELDLTVTSPAVVRTEIQRAFDAMRTFRSTTAPTRSFRVPVVYGDAYGPDLPYVASTLGITPKQLIAAHTGHEYVIRCLAGPIGGPMMSGPSLGADVPRQKSPRARVLSGSVLLAGRQAFIKTMDGPGGWQVIGWTPARLIDLSVEPLVPWAAGDRIRFHCIDEADIRRWERSRLAPA